MAKQLTKFKAEFTALDKKTGDALEAFNSAETNRLHFASMVEQAAVEIGRIVQKLKDKGQTGKKIDDFKDDKEVKDLLKYIDDMVKAQTKSAGEKAAAVAIVKDGYAKLAAMGKELKAEVDNRKKKKDKVIFAIDSKSLPDLEKLLKEIETSADGFEETSKMPKVLTDKGIFEKKAADQLAMALSRTKENQAKFDESDMLDRLIDTRVSQKKAGEAKTLETTLIAALKAAKEGDGDKAAAVKRAKDALAKIEVIAEMFQKKTDKWSKDEQKVVSESKDGKRFLELTAWLQATVEKGRSRLKQVA